MYNVAEMNMLVIIAIATCRPARSRLAALLHLALILCIMPPSKFPV